MGRGRPEGRGDAVQLLYVSSPLPPSKMATESKHETGRHGHAKFICAWRGRTKERRERWRERFSNADFVQKESSKVLQKGKEEILYTTSMRERTKRQKRLWSWPGARGVDDASTRPPAQPRPLKKQTPYFLRRRVQLSEWLYLCGLPLPNTLDIRRSNLLGSWARIDMGGTDGPDPDRVRFLRQIFVYVNVALGRFLFLGARAREAFRSCDHRVRPVRGPSVTVSWALAFSASTFRLCLDCASFSRVW